jgi:hypothetical protein
MNVAFVAVVIVMVVIVVTAAGLLLRSIVASKLDYRRDLEDIRRIREDVRAAAPTEPKIAVDREDWAGTSTDLPG